MLMELESYGFLGQWVLCQSCRTYWNALDKLNAFAQDRFKNNKENGEIYFFQRYLLVMSGIANQHILKVHCADTWDCRWTAVHWNDNCILRHVTYNLFISWFSFIPATFFFFFLTSPATILCGCVESSILRMMDLCILWTGVGRTGWKLHFKWIHVWKRAKLERAYIREYPH